MQALLEPRLRIKARQLARLSASGQLVIFMGSGMSKTAGLPSWSELLAEIAISVGSFLTPPLTTKSPTTHDLMPVALRRL